MQLKPCQENHLSLNIDKTKELVVDFRRQSREHTVERVNSFKFLGVHITEDLTWSAHTDSVLKKAHQRLSLLIIRSSNPPSQHWTPLGFHFPGLNLTGRSFRVAWEGELSKAHQLVIGVPQGSIIGPPPFLHIHSITRSHHTGTWLLLPLLR